MKNFPRKSSIFLLNVILVVFISLRSFSQSGSVLSLDGSAGTYMSVGDHDDIDINPGENYTITCKIKTTTTVANPRILAKRNGTSGTAVGYEFISSGTGQFGGNLRSTPVSAGPAFSTATINNGQWRHVAMVVDQASGNSKIYVDGMLDKTSATWAAPQDFSNAMALIIGADATTSHLNLWAGQIDNIRLWNKAMLAAEVDADRSAVISGPATNLMACWDFDNVLASTVPDVSGNNHPGMLNGNALIIPSLGNMQYIGTNLLQTELPAGKGDVDQRIIAVNVTTAGTTNPLNLTSIRFTMNGTTSLADVSGIKIYYTGAANRFATTTQFAAAMPQSGVIAASGTQTLASGNNYFWIAYDVTPGAAENNGLDATCEGITVDGTMYNFISPNNTVAGDRKIFLTNKLLFSGGDYGSSNYRIPAIVTAADGSLVTVTDKRWNGAGDLAAKIDPVVRRSTDNGQSWSAPLTIANFGGPNGAGDAALVVDKIKNPGTILCLFAANKGFFSSTPGVPINIQLCKSTDNGITWTAPADITNQVYGAACSNPLTQAWYGAFVSSGKMHQLRSGRIVGVMAVRQTSASTIDNFVLYSDDGGTTWSVLPGIAAAGQADEAKIIELNNGNLMISTRHAGARRISISTNGGTTWGTATVQNQLVEPGCNGDIIRYSSTFEGAPQNVLLHSIPNNASSRKNVSVFVSIDEGVNWTLLKTIYPQASAYSGLAVLADSTVGIYYECGEYDTYQMYFTRFSVPQLIAPLPVKLLGFSTACTGNGVAVKWKTAQEVNSDFFEIQNSADGINWNKLATVKAQGVSSAAIQYSYNDILMQGKYYRLKMVDKDEKFTFSNVSVTTCSPRQWNASVYPNPANYETELTLSGLQKGAVEIDMLNAQGQKIWRKIIAGDTFLKKSIATGHLAKGLYFLTIKNGELQSTISFVKQ